MKFLNLTQFPATKEQAEQGVVNLEDNSKLKELLRLSIDTNLEERADEIWKLAVSEGGLMPGDSVLIAGAPSLMAPLEKRMREGFIVPYYSFSERVSSERVDENGNTIKVSEFKHKKFIEGELDKNSSVFNMDNVAKRDNRGDLHIVNLTQHNATEEQMRDGVFEPKDKDAIKKLITFTGDEDIKATAKEVARIARENGANAAMIGGAPYFMAPLEEALAKEGITPLYAFSEQKQKTITLEDGTVKKVNEFKYLGLVEAGNTMNICRTMDEKELVDLKLASNNGDMESNIKLFDYYKDINDIEQARHYISEAVSTGWKMPEEMANNLREDASLGDLNANLYLYEYSQATMDKEASNLYLKQAMEMGYEPDHEEVSAAVENGWRMSEEMVNNFTEKAEHGDINAKLYLSEYNQSIKDEIEEEEFEL